MKQKKVLYFDTETTGRDPIKNDIIQISGIIEWDGREIDRFDFRVKPYAFVRIDREITKLEKGKSECIAQEKETVTLDSDHYKQVLDKYDAEIQKLRVERELAVDPKALEVNGITIEQLESYPDPDIVFTNLKAVFNRHINQYDRNDKFIPVAHNGKFDMDFLSAFFQKNNDPYFGAWISWNLIDTLAIARYLFLMSNIPIDNFKLETLCKYFGIPLEAHDSMNDIVATRELLFKMNGVILGLNNEKLAG